MAESLFRNSFEDLCHYHQISDFTRQIVNYGQEFSDRMENETRLIPHDDLKRSIDEGFYLGEAKCRLGEFLSYTQLPEYLKRFWPEAKVFICENPLSAAVFDGNPFIDGIQKIPERTPMGGFTEFGFGTQTQRRLRYFRIFETRPLAPRIYVSQTWDQHYQHWKGKLPLHGRKLVLFQSSGRTVKKLLSFWRWQKLFRDLENEFYFVQVGSPRDSFVWPHKRIVKSFDIRELVGLLNQADCFIGPNSGLMHLISALKKPAVILHTESVPEEMYLPVLGDNLYLPKPVNHHLFHCYPWHFHINIADQRTNAETQNHAPTGPFFNAFNLEGLRNLLRSAVHGQNPLWTQLAPHFDHGATVISPALTHS